MKTVQW